MVLLYNTTTSMPDYWISLTRQQQATESDKHTHTSRLCSLLRLAVQDGVRTTKLGRRCRARFCIPYVSHPRHRSFSQAK